MGKFFGSEPRYSREEIERQAQEAIDARVNLGRPPAEEWQPLELRMDEIDQAIVSRRADQTPAARQGPAAGLRPEPVQVRQVPTPAEPAPARLRALRRPVAARPGAG